VRSGPPPGNPLGRLGTQADDGVAPRLGSTARLSLSADQFGGHPLMDTTPITDPNALNSNAGRQRGSVVSYLDKERLATCVRRLSAQVPMSMNARLAP
jgi:hypothetical protein